MEQNTKRIKIKVSTRKTSDGRSFTVYKTVTKNGRLIDCKFRKEVTNVPTVDSYIICPVDSMNMQKNSEFPVLWVSQILQVEPISGGPASDEQRAKNAAQINEMFD